MTAYIYDVSDPAIRTEFNNVAAAIIRQVNSETSVIDIKFNDGKLTAREYDSTRFNVRLNESN